MNCRILILAAVPVLMYGQGANTNASSSRSNTERNNATLSIKCKGPGGAPCTAAQVDAIARGVPMGKRQWQTLAAVRNVSLGGADGTLKCEQNSGKPCTEDQIKALINVAGELKCTINYNASKSNTVTSEK